MDEALHLFNEFSDERVKIRIETVQAFLDLQLGNYAAARQRLAGNIRSAHKRNDIVLSSILTIFAIVLLEQDLAMWSAKVLGLIAESMGEGQKHAELVLFERVPRVQGFQAKLRARLGAEAFDNHHMAGKQLTLDDVLAIPHPAAQIQTSSDSLTPRELEVLHLLAEDLTNTQIAERLVLSRRTVDAHLRSIYVCRLKIPYTLNTSTVQHKPGKEHTMSANFEYNRLHAQSKISSLQQEGIRSQQLKQLNARKSAPATKDRTGNWFQALKLKLFRPSYS